MTKIRRNLPNNQYLAALLANSPSTSNVFATIADLADLGTAVTSASKLQHDVKYAQQINKGQAVYVSSADGTNMIVSKADNSSEGTSSKTMGLVLATGNANYQGTVITEGLLSGLNTSGANAGDPVWLGTAGNLIFGLVNKPSAPQHLVFIGIVTRVGTNNGEIFVKVQNGFEMHELHDVSLPSYISNGVLYRDTVANLWKTASIQTLLGYTPVNNTFTIATSGPLNGASDLSGIGMTLSISQASNIIDGYLSSTDWTTFNNKVPTTRSISTTAPLSGGGDLSLDRTISIPKATTTIDGYLSATDWTIFNGKQAALGFTPANKAGDTFTGNISASNLSGTNTGDESTATIKTKLGAASASQDGYLTSTDWSIFSGKGVGTVTSVSALTISTTGLDISSTVATGTTTPVITLVIPTASSIARGALSSADWSTFNGKIGSSGTTTTNYISKFTANGIIGNSIIQDNGTQVGIGTAASSSYKLTVAGTIYGAGSGSGTFGVTGENNGDAAGTYIGVKGAASKDESPTAGNKYIGGWFYANGTSAYSVMLQDGTESVAGRFLKNMDTSGRANWATLTIADTGLTITTTGTSGAATLVGNTLNIPQYTSSGVSEKSGNVLGTSRSLPFRMATGITTYRSASGVGSTTISSTTFAGESTHYYPISLKEGSPVRAAAFRVNSAGSGGLGTAEMEIGIYNATTNANGELIPGTLEVQFGKVSVLSTGVKEAVLASPYTLGATVDNIYWIAIRSYSTNSNSLNIYSTTDVLSSWIGMSSSTALVKLGMFIATTPYTAPTGLPASLPVTGGVGFTQSTTVAGYTVNQLLIGLR